MESGFPAKLQQAKRNCIHNLGGEFCFLFIDFSMVLVIAILLKTLWNSLSVYNYCRLSGNKSLSISSLRTHALALNELSLVKCAVLSNTVSRRRTLRTSLLFILCY